MKRKKPKPIPEPSSGRYMYPEARDESIRSEAWSKGFVAGLIIAVIIAFVLFQIWCN